MKQADRVPTKLLWMDLEYTDFDYPRSLMLEVSVEITDFTFQTVASYEARIKNNPKKLVERMALNTFWQDYPANREDFVRNNDRGKDISVVEEELVALIDKHFGDEPAILAGNSIHSDRNVIKVHWPTLDLKLHYRMLDVSSLKILMQAKYGVMYEKKNVHRAFDDIQASIAELQFYLDWFKKS
ncbi:MAG: oligoribonuclease [Candidatus Saccharibacteria bacterium]|nr:oligoribonuclease [Candidatus Saccharibacteria bacterium]